MTGMIITDKLVDKVLSLIEEDTGIKKEKISYELQDNFQFLLISIPSDEFSDIDRSSIFKKVAHHIDKVMPGRTDDNSWMVNLTSDGKVVDSYFGGDMNSPTSGL